MRLSVEGDRLVYDAPRGVLTPGYKAEIVRHRESLLAGLGRCPRCANPLKEGRCWRCNYRLCRCGRDTGSAFIGLCLTCDMMEGG